jgi:hypothetical protein
MEKRCWTFDDSLPSTVSAQNVSPSGKYLVSNARATDIEYVVT